MAAYRQLDDWERFLDGKELRVYTGARRRKLMQESILKVVANPSPLAFKDLPQKVDLIKAIGVSPIFDQHTAYSVPEDDTDVVWNVYAEYQRLLARDNALDFGDYMIMAKRISIQDRTIREKATPDLLIVDEAHDLSISQWEVLRLLTYNPDMPDSKRVRVFGDPKQQLYEFRGALGSQLEQKMADYFGDFKDITLTKNSSR